MFGKRLFPAALDVAAAALLDYELESMPGTGWAPFAFAHVPLESASADGDDAVAVECRGYCLLSDPACDMCFVHPVTGGCVLASLGGAHAGTLDDPAPAVQAVGPVFANLGGCQLKRDLTVT